MSSQLPARPSPHLQLVQRLLDGLREGRWPSGLPSERMLSRSQAVSRHTARKALSLLCQRGMLERRRGSGTYLAETPPTAADAAELPPNQAWADAPKGPRRWLRAEVGPATAEELFSLGLSPGSRVTRLQWMNADAAGAWVELEQHCLAAALPTPLRFDGSLEAWLADQGLRLARSLQCLGACNASPAQAELLGVDPGAALLQVRRQAYAAQGQALLLSQSYRLGAAAGLVLELRR
jgi:GntR family transcriptional regulator